MNSDHNILDHLSRREMLKSVSSGFGYLALAGMCAEAAKADPLAPKTPHFVPKAKRVIFFCMRGGPSHVDTFDYKPQLKVDAGKPGLGRRKQQSSQADALSLAICSTRPERSPDFRTLSALSQAC